VIVPEVVETTKVTEQKVTPDKSFARVYSSSSDKEVRIVV